MVAYQAGNAALLTKLQRAIAKRRCYSAASLLRLPFFISRRPSYKSWIHLLLCTRFITTYNNLSTSWHFIGISDHLRIQTDFQDDVRNDFNCRPWALKFKVMWWEVVWWEEMGGEREGGLEWRKLFTSFCSRIEVINTKDLSCTFLASPISTNLAIRGRPRQHLRQSKPQSHTVI